MKWLDVKKGERILDVGCGGGVLSLMIAEKGSQASGVDVSAKGINNAKLLAQRVRIVAEFEVVNAQQSTLS